MDIIAAIKSRRSIRRFKPDPVPREVLRDIIEAARRAPSTMNTQPWEITIVTGKVLADISQGNVELLNAGVTPEMDVILKPFTGVYRQRQVALAVQIFGLMGIAREDKVSRVEWWQRGFRFFDAPAAFIISVDRSVGEMNAQFDVGAISQTICLAALAYGLGTCIAEQGITYPDVVREYTGIPESKRLIVSIAIGYPDGEFPANKLVSGREPLENFVTWCGFD